PAGAHCISVIHLPKHSQLIIYTAVGVKELAAQGKKYAWARPEMCPRCGGTRLWGHGYVMRSFAGYEKKVWVKRWRCPDCSGVHTMRPASHWSRFQYSRFVILLCMVSRVAYGKWRWSQDRQNQQYWYPGLVKQSSRHVNTPSPDVEAIRRLIALCIIPVSHSIQSEQMRL
ncbi:MAG: hypothetical protein AAB214_00560, partial [Fibrobacterota bacterium]